MKKKHIPGQHSVHEFAQTLREFEEDHQIKSVLIFSGGNTSIDPAQYDPILMNTRLSIMGSIFPEIIFEGKRFKEGTIIMGCSNDMQTMIISDWETDIEKQISETFEDTNPVNKSVWMFIDALVSEKSKLFDSLYNVYGTIPKYIGGGAGTLEFNKFPCVYSNDGMIEMGAVVGVCSVNASVGVAHGWEPISKPLKVTESVGNKVISLDWEPAMDVYQKIVESHSKEAFRFDDFLTSVKSYPFGISKLNADMVIRDPFKQEDKCVFTLDNIDQGSHVSVMFGSPDSLIEGARDAKKKAVAKIGDKESQILIIDCISRGLFLGSSFEKELACLDEDNTSFGALTLGEIANNGDSYLEVFNRTAVVCALYE